MIKNNLKNLLYLLIVSSISAFSLSILVQNVGAWSETDEILETQQLNSSNLIADYVIGQPSFETNVPNNGGVSSMSLNGPSSVFTDGNITLIADSSNHRVLIFEGIPGINGADSIADGVIGQPDFTSNIANNGGISASSLNYPMDVFYNGFETFVADGINNRVLIYEGIPGINGADSIADVVVGQPDFSSNIANNGGISANSMRTPHSIYVDKDYTYISEYSNHRVLIYSGIPGLYGNDVTADYVIGQPDFTSSIANSGGVSASSLSSPRYISKNNGYIFVVDAGNNRILKYDKAKIDTEIAHSAISVLGQSNFYEQSGGTDNSSFKNPFSITFINSIHIATDYANNRALIFTDQSELSDAFLVLGQPDFVSSSPNNGGVSSSSLYWPRKIYAYDPYVLIADYGNNRVLIYNFDSNPPKINFSEVYFSENRPILHGSTSDTSSSITSVQYQIDNSNIWVDCLPTDGTWDSKEEEYSCNISVPLSEGTHTVTIQATDSKTNASEDTYTFTVDTTRPTIRIIDLGLITNIPDKTPLHYYFTSQTPHINGTSESNSTVHFKYDGKDYTTVTNNKGSFEITIDNPELPREYVEITYYSQDQAGNKSEMRKLNLTIGVENFPVELISNNAEDTDQDTIDTETEEETSDIDQMIYKYKIIDSKGNILPETTITIEGQEYISDEEGYIYVEVKLEDNLQAQINQGSDLVTGYVKGEQIVIDNNQTDNNAEIVKDDNVEEDLKPNYWYLWLLLILLIIGGCYYIWKRSKKES